MEKDIHVWKLDKVFLNNYRDLKMSQHMLKYLVNFELICLSQTIFFCCGHSVFPKVVIEVLSIPTTETGKKHLWWANTKLSNCIKRKETRAASTDNRRWPSRPQLTFILYKSGEDGQTHGEQTKVKRALLKESVINTEN